MTGHEPLSGPHTRGLEFGDLDVSVDEGSVVTATAHSATTTQTFLFADIESSSSLWERVPQQMAAAIDAFETQSSAIIGRVTGTIFKFLGDGFVARFDLVTQAVSASIALQRRFSASAESPLDLLSLRIGIHTGEAERRGDDYFGSSLNLAARVADSGFGGQIVLSGVSADLLRHSRIDGVDLRDMGEFNLRGFDLPERLFLLEHASLPSPTGSLRIEGHRVDNIPVPASKLIGRERDLVVVRENIALHQVVTLTGGGGVGKTRLAIEGALDTVRLFRHGSIFCDLATVGDERSALPYVATALGVQCKPEATIDEAIAYELRKRQLLILLDNCEHVLGPVRALVKRLVAMCPEVKILSTSRQPLNVPGERVHEVRSLVVPAAETSLARIPAGDSEAEELLLDRARAANGRLALDPEDMLHVREICRRLDGLPLALELAGARFRSLSPKDIALRLDHRFKLLADPNDRVGRHGTLRTVVQWSYDLLTEPEQQLFARLCVFVGGFTLESAEQVGVENLPNDSLDDFDLVDALGALVEKSIVAFDGASSGRYRINETFRAFGREILLANGQLRSAEDRFIAHWLAFAARGLVGLHGSAERAWGDRLEDEFDNLRATFQALLDRNDAPGVFALLLPLFDFGLWRMRYEYGDWCMEALRLDGAEVAPGYVDVSAPAAYRQWARGDLEAAGEVMARALAVETDLGLPPSLLLRDAMASIALYSANWSLAVRHQEDWMRLAVESGSPFRRARALFTGSILASASGDAEAAGRLAVQGLALGQEGRNATMTSWGLHAMAQAVRKTDPQRAMQLFGEAAEHAKGVRNQLQAGLALREFADIQAGSDRSAAMLSFRDVLRHWHRFGDWANSWLTIQKFAGLLVDVGRADLATLGLVAVDVAHANDGISRARQVRLLDRCRAILPPSDFLAAERTGSSIAPDDAIQLMISAADELAGSV